MDLLARLSLGQSFGPALWQLPWAVARRIFNTMLPPCCPSCRAVVSSDGAYCTACFARLRFITAPQCRCCGLPFSFDAGPDAKCPTCISAPPRFAAARAPLVYEGAARTTLLGFKNHNRQHLARFMAAAMIRSSGDMLAGNPVLVPVPLHRWRLWQRGFNQAAVLAQAIARQSGHNVAVDALVRVRASARGRGMGRDQRAANVRGVFKPLRAAGIVGRKVVLVDDVLTTGATAQACTRQLLRAGATSVHVLTWARVVQGSEVVT